VLWLPEAARRRLLSIGSVRYTRAMPESVRELLVTPTAIDKLGGRGITITEAEHLFKNTHRSAPNPGSGRRRRKKLENDQVS